MANDNVIREQLEDAARRGARPEKAQAALAQVPGLFDELGALEAQLTRATADAESTLQAAARHLVSAGGKRIRPTVALLSCGACGGEMAAAVPFGVAAELTHSATLLHDDVIDDGPMRRGMPASRVIWGNTVSVLAGDWLLTRSLEITAGHPAAARALPALLATMRRLVEGEVKQLSLRGGFRATEQDYFQVIEGKTASLFGWACCGGRLGGRPGGRHPGRPLPLRRGHRHRLPAGGRRPRLRRRSREARQAARCRPGGGEGHAAPHPRAGRRARPARPARPHRRRRRPQRRGLPARSSRR